MALDMLSFLMCELRKCKAVACEVCEVASDVIVTLRINAEVSRFLHVPFASLQLYVQKQLKILKEGHNSLHGAGERLSLLRACHLRLRSMSRTWHSSLLFSSRLRSGSPKNGLTVSLTTS